MSAKLLRVLRLSALVSVCAAFTGNATSAQDAAEAPNGDAGRLLWSAFECRMYAQMSGEPEKETVRLRQIGYENGKRFLEGVRNKTITETEINSKVPIGVRDAMAGPTDDFILGRIYELATTVAYDRVVKAGSFDLDLPPSQWHLDPEVQKIRAGTEFRTQNCALLK
jgi:hypothetical protein